MTRLAEALGALGVRAHVAPSGRWVEFEGGRCRAYVTAAPSDGAFYVWCGDPAERVVERYTDPIEAIAAGLRRAAKPGGEREDDG